MVQLVCLVTIRIIVSELWALLRSNRLLVWKKPIPICLRFCWSEKSDNFIQAICRICRAVGHVSESRPRNIIDMSDKIEAVWTGGPIAKIASSPNTNWPQVDCCCVAVWWRSLFIREMSWIEQKWNELNWIEYEYNTWRRHLDSFSNGSRDSHLHTPLCVDETVAKWATVPFHGWCAA